MLIMTLFGKFLGFVPVITAFFMCDKTFSNFCIIMMEGMIVWVPYWLAWLLTNGFRMSNDSSD